MKLYRYFSAHPKLIFLADGLGALLSTLLLFGVAALEEVFGMPANVLYKLVPVTALFAVYSIGIYFAGPRNPRPYLTAIALANILYCCLTLVLIFYYLERLTVTGLAYFFMEILIIVTLSIFELCLAKGKSEERI